MINMRYGIITHNVVLGIKLFKNDICLFKIKEKIFHLLSNYAHNINIHPGVHVINCVGGATVYRQRPYLYCSI